MNQLELWTNALQGLMRQQSSTRQSGQVAASIAANLGSGSHATMSGSASGIQQTVQRAAANTSERSPREAVNRDTNPGASKPTAKDMAEGWGLNCGQPY